MKKLIVVFSMMFLCSLGTSCTPEALQEINPVACCDNGGDIPPPPPPPPPPPKPPGIGDD